MVVLANRYRARREDLVLFGTINDGRSLSPSFLEKELNRALTSLGLETLDLAIIKVLPSKCSGTALIYSITAAA